MKNNDINNKNKIYKSALYFLLSISCFNYADTLPKQLLKSQSNKSYVEVIAQAQLSEVAHTITPTQIKDILLDSEQTLNINTLKTTIQERQSAALLKKLGCITKIELKPPQLIQCKALSPLANKHLVIPKEIINPLNLLLRNNIIQGYNIKQNKNHNNNSLQNNTLLYGHSSLAHAKQLIILLTLNQVKFTWELIPKTSAFNIRSGWNDITDNELQEKIRYAQEYDLKLAFENHQEKLKFMPLINQYAKRDNNNQQGLIIHAWWQPFYRSLVQEQNYKKVTRINLVFSHFTASTLALNTQQSDVINHIQKQLVNTPSIVKINTESIWVNPSFYRYLTGKYQ
ncbi:hypothetical protein ACM9HF_20385 [Colwellia sp. RE-S-Sl-9]